MLFMLAFSVGMFPASAGMNRAGSLLVQCRAVFPASAGMNRRVISGSIPRGATIQLDCLQLLYNQSAV